MTRNKIISDFETVGLAVSEYTRHLLRPGRAKQGLAANHHTVVHLLGKIAVACYSSYSEKNHSLNLMYAIFHYIYIFFLTKSNPGMIFSNATKQTVSGIS